MSPLRPKIMVYRFQAVWWPSWILSASTWSWNEKWSITRWARSPSSRCTVVPVQPLQHNCAFPHLTNSQEERTDDHQLKIIESTAFKVVIQNISSEVWSLIMRGYNQFQPIRGDYIVVRKTREERATRRKAPIKNKCQFSFKIEWWLDPGATITVTIYAFF